MRIETWLNKHISKLDWGERFDRPVHMNNKATLLELYGCRRQWVPAITYKMYQQHWDGDRTVYFTGNERGGHTLVMIDIDCHASGTREGAFAFASWLRAHHMPGLYYEESTNGNGCHGYFIVDYTDHSPEELCDLLKQIEKWIQSVSKGWDIEMVEIKGHPHCRNFQPVAGAWRSHITMGQLAKVPREMHRRAEELQATYAVDFGEAEKKFVPVAKEAANPTAGSDGRRIFREKRLAGLKPGGRYYNLAVALEKPDTGGAAVVTTADFAILLMLLEHCTENGNDDGSMPTARLRELWRSLYEVGDVERAWSNRRFSAMRNELARWGWIEMEDNTFIIGNEENEGRAMAWHGSEDMMDAVSDSEYKHTHTTFVVSHPYTEPLGQAQYLPLCVGFTTALGITRLVEPDLGEMEAELAKMLPLMRLQWDDFEVAA